MNSNKLFVTSLVFLLFARLGFEKINMFYALLVEGIASAVIIWILVDSKREQFFNRFLELNIIKKLGKISYSFYLYHFIVMYWTAYGICLVIKPEISANYPLLLSGIIVVLSVPIAYYLAILSYYGVELPYDKIWWPDVR